MKKSKANITEWEPEEEKGNCSICGVETSMEYNSRFCVCDNCAKEKHLLVCSACHMAVEYTEDEYESGRCKGLFRFNRFTWLCENREECVRIKKTETEDERKLWLYGPVEKRRYRPKKMCPKCNGRLIIRYNYNICESCNTH